MMPGALNEYWHFVKTPPFHHTMQATAGQGEHQAYCTQCRRIVNWMPAKEKKGTKK